VADITLGQFYEAIRQSAREGTLQALKELLEEIDFATNTSLNQVLAALSTLAGTVDDGAQKVTLTGQLPPSAMEIYGPTVAQRPAANSVPVGAVYMAVNTGEIWQSNGTNWVVLI